VNGKIAHAPVTELAQGLKLELQVAVEAVELVGEQDVKLARFAIVPSFGEDRSILDSSRMSRPDVSSRYLPGSSQGC